MRTIKKIKRIIAAVVVAFAAFFELCFTGAAVRSWKLARSDSLSLRAGAKVTSAGNPKPRPVLFVSRGAGKVIPPPAPAPHFFRRLFVTAAIAIVVIAAVFCVARPDGLEDVTTRCQAASMDQATEGPSSNFMGRKERIVLFGCLLFSIALAAASIAIRKESYYGKAGKECRGQD